ncbi:MAG: hypothetical protein ACI4E5_08205 [Suilimivivens sp.]|nr:hypothetical protein [Lachnospiraceae bacterium]
MQVGALGFKPYIYNTNVMSGNSLSKVSSVEKDLLASKTDYSSLTDESLNENPLRRGQTANFVDILGMQMQMSRLNASRIMKPEEEMQGLSEAANDMVVGDSSQMTEDETAINGTMVNGSAMSMSPETVAKDFQPVSGVEEMQNMQTDRNLFQMQRAAMAYQAAFV